VDYNKDKVDEARVGCGEPTFRRRTASIEVYSRQMRFIPLPAVFTASYVPFAPSWPLTVPFSSLE